MSSKITVIGSANADLVIHSEKMPQLGETLTGSDFQINAGGKGLNQAVAIAKLGGNVSFIGALGKDSNASVLLDTLNENGVLFEGRLFENEPTGIAMITVVNSDNFIILNPGANYCLTPEIIEENEQKIAESDFCVLQLEIPIETVAKVCEISKKHGTKVILNPAPYKELSPSLLANVDYLIPNEHEARDITGIYPDNEENCIKTVQKLLSMGVKNTVITLGERGCVYNDNNEIKFHSAVPVKAVDTTSAGDCFIGALTTKLSQGCPIDKAIAFASKASAITVSRQGASKSIPFAHEVE
ncbi:MAG: ribokinase [Ruminococcaceae bacterium]|nr:ribokinase [Oscillospiraceae bacterium]